MVDILKPYCKVRMKVAQSAYDAELNFRSYGRSGGVEVQLHTFFTMILVTFLTATLDGG